MCMFSCFSLNFEGIVACVECAYVTSQWQKHKHTSTVASSASSGGDLQLFVRVRPRAIDGSAYRATHIVEQVG